jgi:hypothetical protein
VTRERIRQIEAKALRHPSRSRKLKAFVDGVKAQIKTRTGGQWKHTGRPYVISW